MKTLCKGKIQTEVKMEGASQNFQRTGKTLLQKLTNFHYSTSRSTLIITANNDITLVMETPPTECLYQTYEFETSLLPSRQAEVRMEAEATKKKQEPNIL